MMHLKKSNSQDPVIWYSDNKTLFEQLAKRVESILNEMITDHKIPFHAIHSRAKEIKSFSGKIVSNDLKYDDPINQITDLAGIRIITYVESDLEKVSKLIESSFEIDANNSVDKTKTLGTDKVGYRSIHYVAKLSKERVKLPEYKKFEGLSFEIQIRTILQHAWAEIEHDKDYKFSGELPTVIKRRFKVLSGVLELADREFNAIATEIDNYQKAVTKSTNKGKLDIELNSNSINTFIKKRFDFNGKIDTLPYNDSTMIAELKKFGIENIEQLNSVISDELVDYLKDNRQYLSSIGIIRSAMMVKDIDKYFEKSWNNNWQMMGKGTYDFLKEKDIPVDTYLKNNVISISESKE